ncbi:hypothetical protein GGX14DRAFT_387772 [Mycena pura]|uniref:Uncharacterized protein n=1 Tax=Mycena pura TaxID=153505 RepID=A0AAD6YMJ0_9AGAR|nr:hypothetical protein GGX14DRAFT_387772 [Mycena pura]
MSYADIIYTNVKQVQTCNRRTEAPLNVLLSYRDASLRACEAQQDREAALLVDQIIGTPARIAPGGHEKVPSRCPECPPVVPAGCLNGTDISSDKGIFLGVKFIKELASAKLSFRRSGRSAQEGPVFTPYEASSTVDEFNDVLVEDTVGGGGNESEMENEGSRVLHSRTMYLHFGHALRNMSATQKISSGCGIDVAHISDQTSHRINTGPAQDASCASDVLGPLWDEECDSWDENIGRAPYRTRAAA